MFKHSIPLISYALAIGLLTATVAAAGEGGQATPTAGGWQVKTRTMPRSVSRYLVRAVSLWWHQPVAILRTTPLSLLTTS